MMDDSELLMRYNEVKDKCMAILKECKKWEKHPDAVFLHGYAEEKAIKLLDNIQYTRDKLSER